MKPILEIKNISKKYKLRGQESPYLTLRDALMSGFKVGKTKDEFWALKDISFDVYPGESIGIIGRNGAGKSTLLKILSRITPPTTGEIIARGRIASLLEVGTGFHPELTGKENIFLNGSILGLTKNEIKSRFDEIVAFSNVEKFLETPLKHYSSGMQLRLAFAVAAHLDPEILIIDEVLAVGDAEFQKKSLGKMNEVTQSGRTVLFVSHNMAAVKNLCSRSILLDAGKIIYQDTSDIVIRKYLENIVPSLNESLNLATRKDRSGNGIVKFINFKIEDEKGDLLNSISSGMNITFIFEYKCIDIHKANNVDVGFSLHTMDEITLSVNYSSYYNIKFNNIKEKGEFRFKINHLPLAQGNYKIGGRILVDNEESDWPKNLISSFYVEKGDFYKSGKEGFSKNVPILLEGSWS